MEEHAQIVETANAIAAAIARQDTQTISELLAPDFLLRTPGGATISAPEFLSRVREIPVEILFVRLEQLQLDISPGGALVTGIQHAQMRADGEKFDALRPFADWFVKNSAGRWQLRIALDLPELPDMAEDEVVEIED
jgi:ketosteroid isomerase-like protein